MDDNKNEKLKHPVINTDWKLPILSTNEITLPISHTQIFTTVPQFSKIIAFHEYHIETLELIYHNYIKLFCEKYNVNLPSFRTFVCFCFEFTE